ncbi:NADPH oxidase activator 1 [Rhineura floridana]|uniref:NADPH oxidase activator 1 n=1 Tax=Rhineura floridana TaxID=261503 RepID=UPI002AC80BCE|nr:NADPH oxidase activator 1 [Rhineura floridana]
MAYRDLIRDWNEGVLALENSSWESALNIFCRIENPHSKIDFNIGCLHLGRGDLERALEAFDQSVSKDNCLAVGFFQRGYVYLQLERYEEALNDCRLALLHLRTGPFIDYKQLGLKFVLYPWEVLYNTATVYCRLGKWQDARRVLQVATRQTPKSQIHHLDIALEQVQEHLFLEPRSVPQGEIFKPPKKDVEELEEKDFLGQAKVISSAFEGDYTSSFHGLQLQKGRSGIPPPPGKVLPNRPRERQKIPKPVLAEGEVDKGDANIAGPETALEGLSASEEIAHIGESDRPVLLNIHASYTIQMKVSTTPTLAELNALLQEECCRQAAQMSLRYRSPGRDELIPVSDDEELRNVWGDVQGGQLTLWCQGKEKIADRPVLYHMIACHPYTAQGQEDLTFKEGDKLEILSEVNEEWLEGCCNGTVGIFPKCFAVRESAVA